MEGERKPIFGLFLLFRIRKPLSNLPSKTYRLLGAKFGCHLAWVSATDAVQCKCKSWPDDRPRAVPFPDPMSIALPNICSNGQLERRRRKYKLTKFDSNAPKIRLPEAFAVVFRYRMQFSFNAFTRGLSPVISVGCGLKTNSISSFSPNSELPSPSVSTFESFPSVRL